MTLTASNLECPLTTQGKENNSPHTGHQRANTTCSSSQSKENEVSRKLSNKANSKHFNKKDHKGQHNSVSIPAQLKTDRGTPGAQMP